TPPMAAQPPSSSPQDGSGGGGSSENLVLQAPQAVREDYVQNAVNFLAHPKVKGSPVSYRYSFLEKKGLTKEEIDEAFRRVPDPSTSSTDVVAVGSQQGISTCCIVELMK
uniref:Peroxisomal membrane protein PEX14 n=1 Tax=Aegilops tauschii subsp. strangulata TaxID=200361 RepID=A0A453DQJ8_AEGTS